MSDTLFDKLRGLQLPMGDYAIFGSGPLTIRGIIPSSNDLDILCRGDVWDIVSQTGEAKFLADYNVTVASLFDNTVTFGTEWGIGSFDVNELIDTAEIIQELPFVLLEHVVAYKKIRLSTKDRGHLRALAQASGEE